MIDTNSKSKQRQYGIVLNYLNLFAKVLIQFLYVPLLLRFLGQGEYGVYQLSASMISYLSLLNFGFSGSYLRFYFRCKGEKDKIKSLNFTYFVCFTLFSVVATLAGFIISNNAKIVLGPKLSANELQLAKKLLQILTINLAISFPGSVFSSIVSANECFIFQRFVELIKTILNPGIGILALILGYQSIGLVIGTTLINIVAIILNIYYCVRVIHAPLGCARFDSLLLRDVGKFSFFLFLNSVIDMINWNVDQFILGRVAGAAEIAIYSVGAQINTMFIQISDMVATAFAPKVNNIISTKKDYQKEINTLFTNIARIQSVLVFGILFGFLSFGQKFIYFWAGKDYYESFFVAIALMAPSALPLCESLAVDIQRAMNLHQFRSIVYLGISIGNIIVSIPLAKKYGAIGSAIGTSIALVLGNCIIINLFIL